MKKEMTLGELLQSEQFKKKLTKRINQIKAQYEKKEKSLKLGQSLKRNPFLKLRERNALNADTLTNIYAEIINKSSPLPSELRNYVTFICEPVLQQCLVEYSKKFKKEDKKDVRE